MCVIVTIVREMHVAPHHQESYNQSNQPDQLSKSGWPQSKSGEGHSRHWLALSAGICSSGSTWQHLGSDLRKTSLIRVSFFNILSSWVSFGSSTPKSKHKKSTICLLILLKGTYDCVMIGEVKTSGLYPKCQLSSFFPESQNKSWFLALNKECHVY